MIYFVGSQRHAAHEIRKRKLKPDEYRVLSRRDNCTGFRVNKTDEMIFTHEWFEYVNLHDLHPAIQQRLRVGMK